MRREPAPIVPNFGDPNARVKESEENGVPRIDIYYGGSSGNVDGDGHGHWVAKLLDGTWQVIADRKPVREGGRFQINDKDPYDASAERTQDELRQANARRRQEDAAVKEARDKYIAQARSISNLADLRQARQEMDTLFTNWQHLGYGSEKHDDRQWQEFNREREHLYHRIDEDRKERQRAQAQARAAMEDLCARAEALARSSDLRSARDQMKSLMDEWKRAGNPGKPDSEALWTRFRRANDDLFSRINAEREQREREWAQAKSNMERICSRAESVAHSNDTRQARDEMRSLLNEWKKVGRTKKDDSDALWARFRRAQDELHQRIEREKAEREHAWAQAKVKKERICSRAESVSHSTDFRQAKEDMRSLMDEWKSAGRAKKEDEDLLWTRFQHARDRLFNRAKQAQQQREIEMQEVRKRKESIIHSARMLLNTDDFRSATDKIKQLSDEFYNAGSAGKDENSRLKNEFDSVKQTFFERKKLAGEQRRQEAIERLQQRIYNTEVALSRLETAIANKNSQYHDLMMRPDPSPKNPKRWEIVNARNGKISHINAALTDMARKKAEMHQSLMEMQAKLRSMY